MTCPRKNQVSLQDTPYYHLIARCVRRAWLWGVDEYAGKDYSHRKRWVLERLAQLSAVFSIDICAYAVMSNHYHLVVHVDQQRARAWTAQDVVERWTILFSRPALLDRWQQGNCSETEAQLAEALIASWRRRLCDVSWYMRCLNEHLARRANAEDQCSGRFWEGRFKSQALLDEAGLLTAMAYVDLNPVRAGIASAPEQSEFTSAYERIRALADPAARSDVPLFGFRNTASHDQPSIPFSCLDYLGLIDWTGRVIRSDKAGAIDRRLPPILDRLGIDPEVWPHAMRPSGNLFGRAVGRFDRLRAHARTLGQAWVRGLRTAERLYVR